MLKTAIENLKEGKCDAIPIPVFYTAHDTWFPMVTSDRQKPWLRLLVNVSAQNTHNELTANLKLLS